MKFCLKLGRSCAETIEMMQKASGTIVWAKHWLTFGTSSWKMVAHRLPVTPVLVDLRRENFNQEFGNESCVCQIHSIITFGRTEKPPLRICWGKLRNGHWYWQCASIITGDGSWIYAMIPKQNNSLHSRTFHPSHGRKKNDKVGAISSQW